MPIATAIDQATATAAQLKVCPHPHIGAPNAHGVCRAKVWHNPH